MDTMASMIPSDELSGIPSDLPSMVPSDTPSLVPSDMPSTFPSSFDHAGASDSSATSRPGDILSGDFDGILGADFQSTNGNLRSSDSSLQRSSYATVIGASGIIIFAAISVIIVSLHRAKKRRLWRYQAHNFCSSSHDSGSFAHPDHFEAGGDESSPWMRDGMSSLSSRNKDDAVSTTQHDIPPESSPAEFVAEWLTAIETPLELHRTLAIRTTKSVSFCLPDEDGSHDDTALPPAPNLWEITSQDSPSYESRSVSPPASTEDRRNADYDTREDPEPTHGSLTNDRGVSCGSTPAMNFCASTFTSRSLTHRVDEVTMLKDLPSGDSSIHLNPFESPQDEDYSTKVHQWKKLGEV
jgi:hypothetical protein